MMLDYDTEEMPAGIAQKIPGNRDILDDGPDLDVLGYDGVARVERPSASAGLRGPDGVARRSDNKHVYLLVADGREIPRVAKALYVRSALRHGTLWAKTSKAGTVWSAGCSTSPPAPRPSGLPSKGTRRVTRDVTREPDARQARAYPGRVWRHAGEIPDLTAREPRQFADLRQSDRHREETRGRPGAGPNTSPTRRRGWFGMA